MEEKINDVTTNDSVNEKITQMERIVKKLSETNEMLQEQIAAIEKKEAKAVSNANFLGGMTNDY